MNLYIGKLCEINVGGGMTKPAGSMFGKQFYVELQEESSWQNPAVPALSCSGKKNARK